MVTTEIKFGDKLFLTEDYLVHVEEFGEIEPNTVMADDKSLVHGYVVEILSIDSLASLALFTDGGLVEVTDRLLIKPPMLEGTKIWMPFNSPIELLPDY